VLVFRAFSVFGFALGCSLFTLSKMRAEFLKGIIYALFRIEARGLRLAFSEQMEKSNHALVVRFFPPLNFLEETEENVF
jgi:hypothetical protein